VSADDPAPKEQAGEPVEGHIVVSRNARYFTLGPTDGAAREIIFVLHGYGQPADSFLKSFRTLDDGSRLVVAPEGFSRFYPKGMNGGVGASWMTKVDRLLEIEEYVAYLDALRSRIEECARPGAPVTVLGFSQGGATAARWAALGARPASHVVLWGSFLPPDLDLDNGRLRRLPLTLVHGRRDPLIGAEQLRRERERLVQSGIAHEYIEFDGSHGIDEETLKELF
jgi:predicted esterase